ncbi:MAG: hypothetical protein AB1Z20_22545 [Desulfobacterales bacterium]
MEMPTMSRPVQHTSPGFVDVEDRTFRNACFLLVTTVLFGILWLAYRKPAHYFLVVVIEDGWVDYAVAVSYGIAALLFLAVALKRRVLAHRLLFFVLGMACVFLGGEEISWGQRILDFRTPWSLRQINVQGELTLHNLKYIDPYLMTTILAWVTIAWTLCSMIVRRVVPAGNSLVELLRPFFFPQCVMPLFLLFSLFVLIKGFPGGSEVAESILAFAVCIWSLHCYLVYGRGDSIRGRTAVIAMSVLIIVVVALSGILKHRWGFSSQTAEWYLNWAMNVPLPEHGRHSQIEDVYVYVHSNERLLWKTWKTIDLTFSLHLLSTGSDERAREVATSALDRLEASDLAQARNAEDLRIIGILSLLANEPEKATQAFDSAEAYDRARLAKAQSPVEQGVIEWSLARTSLVSGTDDAVSIARNALPKVSAATSPRPSNKIRSWINCIETETLITHCYQWPEIKAHKLLIKDQTVAGAVD